MLKGDMETRATNPLNGPPTPEEIQRHLSELMRQHFKGANVTGFTSTEKEGDADASPDSTASEDFKFDLKPREVKEFLDRFVIKQEEAKKVLSVALCDHYHHVRQAIQGKEQPNYAKQNIILIGPTGVGKTYLVRCLADLIGVPFVKADATKFSETGYVGGDVEDLVRDLVRRHQGRDTTQRGTALAEMESLAPRHSQHNPGNEVPEDNWVYRFAKKHWFFGFGAYT